MRPPVSRAPWPVGCLSCLLRHLSSPLTPTRLECLWLLQRSLWLFPSGGSYPGRCRCPEHALVSASPRLSRAPMASHPLPVGVSFLLTPQILSLGVLLPLAHHLMLHADSTSIRCLSLLPHANSTRLTGTCHSHGTPSTPGSAQCWPSASSS